MLELKGKTIVWDEHKSQKNIRDHNLSLPEMARAFFDPFFVLMYDEAHSQTNETRWKGLGMLGHSLFLLCFVESGGELRLYAVRKAVQKEKEYYMDFRSLKKHFYYNKSKTPHAERPRQRRNDTIVTTSIKFSELKNLPPLTPERLAEIEAFKDTESPGCPELTGEEWRTVKPLYDIPPKADVYVRLDTDLVHWLKVPRKGYQARMNAALRYAMRHGFLA
jgi:uncharacterized DUF497 family protein/uncharacterized protein (DUF4415 family)